MPRNNRTPPRNKWKGLKRGAHGIRYLTPAEIAQLQNSEIIDLEETLEIENRAAGIELMRRGLEAKERGFSLLELCIALACAAIMATLAVPSLMMHNNLVMLQSQVTNLKWGLMQMPAWPLDPSWSQSGQTFTKTLPAPTAGTLTVVEPTRAGQNWSCSFSVPGYGLRC